MAQDGETRAELFQDEMDHVRESQGCTTASSNIPERDEKDHEGNSPKQASSSCFAHHSSLAIVARTHILWEVLPTSDVLFLYGAPYMFTFIEPSPRPLSSFCSSILYLVVGTTFGLSLEIIVWISEIAVCESLTNKKKSPLL